MLTKHVSCKCEYKFGGRLCGSFQNWNKDKFWCECENKKNIICAKKILYEILLHAVAKMVNI